MVIDCMAAILICSVFFMIGRYFTKTPEKKHEEHIHDQCVVADEKMRRAYMNFLSYNGDEQDDI